MGVHGLSSFVKRLGLIKDDVVNPTANDNDDNINDNINYNVDNNDRIFLPADSTTLAIDGNGLIFHLFRLAYHRHCQNVLSTTSSEQHHEQGHDDKDKALQTQQLLLPAFTPLALAHELTTSYLSDLTTKHGLHLQIYFDGSCQYMKRFEKQLRRERREEEWENVRELCLRGSMPEGYNDDKGGGEPSKFRSSAKKQARKHERHARTNSAATAEGDAGVSNAAKNEGGVNLSEQVEFYLRNFPYSPLVLNQIERSIHAFCETMSTMLPYGSVQVVQCKGEADSEVARASASDGSGNTFAVGNDTDYLIYGYGNDENNNNNNNDNIEEGGGEVKYINFRHLNPSLETLSVPTILTRSDVADALGLPCPSAMVEFSILLGNDYTGPFVKHDNYKKRHKYWESLRWCRDEAKEMQMVSGSELENFENSHNGKESQRLPSVEEMPRFDARGIAEHVAEKVAEGYKLTSDAEELRVAINFSYVLYYFGDVGMFPTTAPGSSSPSENENALNDDEDEEKAIDDDLVVFPSLPRGFDISLARDGTTKMDMDIWERALLPLQKYMSEVGVETNNLQYMEQRHLDAFRMTLEGMQQRNRNDNNNNNKHERMIEPPKQKLQWADMQSLYILEKCLLEALCENHNDGAVLQNMPCHIFQHGMFRSFLESLSYDDFPLDNELVSKNEKAFLQEA